MDDETPSLRLEEVRSRAQAAAYEVLDEGDPGVAAEQLRTLDMKSATSWALGAGLWQIWGRIHDEWTHPRGNPVKGAGLARECAAELLEAIGDKEAEREYCDHWIHERLDNALA